MTLNLPYKVRAAIYIIIVLGTAVIVPLNSAGVLNDTVLAVWSSLAGAGSLLAVLNVSKDTDIK